jgi:hypothetical protein
MSWTAPNAVASSAFVLVHRPGCAEAESSDAATMIRLSLSRTRIAGLLWMTPSGLVVVARSTGDESVWVAWTYSAA